LGVQYPFRADLIERAGIEAGSGQLVAPGGGRVATFPRQLP
jgi:hypothetical protein